MERLDQKFFSMFGPLSSAFTKVFGVAIVVLVLLVPPAAVYMQFNKNNAVIQNNKTILKTIDTKVQNMVDDLEIRKQIRIDLFKQLDEIDLNLKNKDKHLDLIEQKINAMDCTKCHCHREK